MNVMVQNNHLLMDVPHGNQSASLRTKEGSSGDFSKLRDAVAKELEASSSKNKKTGTEEQETEAVYGLPTSSPAEVQDSEALNEQETAPEQENPQITGTSPNRELATRIAGMLEGFGFFPDRTEGFAGTDTAFSLPSQNAAPPLFLLKEGNMPTERSSQVPAETPVATIGWEEGIEVPLLPVENTTGQILQGEMPVAVLADASSEAPALLPIALGKEMPAVQPKEVPGEEKTERTVLLRMLEEAVVRSTKTPREALVARPVIQKEGSEEADQPLLLTAQQPVTGETAPEGVLPQAEEAAAPVIPAADREENIANLVERITRETVSGEQEFTIDLKPEFLGKLSIKLITDNDGIRAQIKAADMAAKTLMTQEIAGLTETLRERGVQITSVEVTYEAAAFHFEGGGQGRQPQFGGQNRSRRLRFEGDIDQYELPPIVALTAELDLQSKNSSIEFQA